jgi:general secretion pathway protein K
MALLVVLWIVVAAALIVSAFNATVRSGVSFVSSEVELAQVEALLDAGTEIAAARLIDDDEARRWLPDGSPHVVSFAGADIAIRISDANGLVDLNKADKELLLGLLRQFAGSEAKAKRLRDRILQARKPDEGDAGGDARITGSKPREQVGGTERTAGANALPAFIDIAELRGIEGMTTELYRTLAPFVTVYSRDGRINPLAAPDVVIAAIPGLARADVDTLRSTAAAPKESDAALIDIAQRAGAYLTDAAGPAYLVSVEVRKSKGSAGRVSVLAPELDQQAPYRLIAKRPIGSLALSGLRE